MLTQERIDAIRRFRSWKFPVISIYLNLEPGRQTSPSTRPRLIDLLRPIEEWANRELDHDAKESVRRDVADITGMDHEIKRDVGRGVAIFSCSGAGFRE